MSKNGQGSDCLLKRVKNIMAGVIELLKNILLGKVG